MHDTELVHACIASSGSVSCSRYLLSNQQGLVHTHQNAVITFCGNIQWYAGGMVAGLHGGEC